MISLLDDCLENLLNENIRGINENTRGIKVSFDVPDGEWRSRIEEPTINCYLYNVRQNFDLRTNEVVKLRSPNQPESSVLYKPLARLDCAYCITAWSAATVDSAREEHELLDKVLLTLLRNRQLPDSVFPASMRDTFRPYPIAILSQDGVKNQPDFWRALDQQLKPSLNYILSVPLFDALPEPQRRVSDEGAAISVEADPEAWRVFKESLNRGSPQ